MHQCREERVGIARLLIPRRRQILPQLQLRAQNRYERSSFCAQECQIRREREFCLRDDPRWHVVVEHHVNTRHRLWSRHIARPAKVQAQSRAAHSIPHRRRLPNLAINVRQGVARHQRPRRRIGNEILNRTVLDRLQIVMRGQRNIRARPIREEHIVVIRGGRWGNYAQRRQQQQRALCSRQGSHRPTVSPRSSSSLPCSSIPPTAATTSRRERRAPRHRASVRRPPRASRWRRLPPFVRQ